MHGKCTFLKSSEMERAEKTLLGECLLKGVAPACCWIRGGLGRKDGCFDLNSQP